jgi:ribonuclease P protein component
MRNNPLRSLRKKRDFELVFKSGVVSRSRNLVLHARPNELGFHRLGLSVGKKMGKAVTRNRIKRLLREAVRRTMEEAPSNYDFVLVAKKPSAEGGLDDFVRDIKIFLSVLFDEESSRKTYNVV